MPEQPWTERKWSERTLDMPPQDPWADPPTQASHTQASHTQASHTQASPPPAAPGPSAQGPDGQPFSRGRAQVNPHPRTQQFAAGHEPTGTGWPGAEPPQRRSVGWHMRELRRGGEWSFAAALFAFVCWGVWVISTDGSDLTVPVVVFMLSLIVAGGLFALARVVGRVVLEKQFHRVRRSARGSHLLAALFLVGVGVAHLRQTPWVMDAYRWVADLLW